MMRQLYKYESIMCIKVYVSLLHKEIGVRELCNGLHVSLLRDGYKWENVITHTLTTGTPELFW